MASHIKLLSPPKNPSKLVSWLSIKPQGMGKKKANKWGKLTFPQVSSASPCISESGWWLCEFGPSHICLGFQPALGTSCSVCSAHPYSTFAALRQAQDIHVVHFFPCFPGNPLRILQSGNNKICIMHQCSLNALAFAALCLTSCSLSCLETPWAMECAPESLIFEECSRMPSSWVCLGPHTAPFKLTGLSEERKVI